MEILTRDSYNIYEDLLSGNTFSNLQEEFWLEISSMGYSADVLNDKNWMEREIRSYFKGTSSGWKENFYKSIIEELKSSTNKNYLIDKHYKKINTLLARLKVKFHKWEFFSEDLEELLEDLQAYMNVSIPETNEISITSVPEMKSTIYPKIKWKGKNNVLATLFYDLLNGQDNKEPLIEANKNDVMNFIIENFTDSDGNLFNKSSITTYFSISKDDKRANKGDRIEIGNVKVQ
jgi:hypothetical protein